LAVSDFYDASEHPEDDLADVAPTKLRPAA
jgi:hypothetical protein